VKDSIRYKLESTRERLEEVAGLMADPDVIGDQNQFRDLSREYARLDPIAAQFTQFELLNGDLDAAREMAADADVEIRRWAKRN
jgi:peptide chain release factor 1